MGLKRGSDMCKDMCDECTRGDVGISTHLVGFYWAGLVWIGFGWVGLGDNRLKSRMGLWIVWYVKRAG